MPLVIIYNVLDSKYIMKGLPMKNESWGMVKVMNEVECIIDLIASIAQALSRATTTSLPGP